MSRATQSIAVFFAFANDRVERARYLRNLPEEQRQVRDAMAAAVEAGLCEVVERANATVDEVLDVFQDPKYRDRVAVFHFGGHAGSAELLLESAEGKATVAHAGGLARFLSQQRGLELIYVAGSAAPILPASLVCILMYTDGACSASVGRTGFLLSPRLRDGSPAGRRGPPRGRHASPRDLWRPPRDLRLSRRDLRRP